VLGVSPYAETLRRNRFAFGEVYQFIASVVANDDGVDTVWTRREATDPELLSEVHAVLERSAIR